MIDLRAKGQPLDAGALMGLSAGFVLSSVLHAAVEVRLFAALGEMPEDLAALAERLGLSPHGLARLVDALVPLGLVARHDDGRVAATALAAQMLTPSSPFARVLMQQHVQLYPLFFHLGDAVRSGEPQTVPWHDDDGGDLYHAMARKPGELQLFLDAMNASSMGVGHAIAEQAELAHVERVIDLGGGGGQVAVELLQAAPRLRVDLIDFPAACSHAQAVAQAAGVSDRLRALPGDLFGALPPLRPAPCVLLSGVLGDFDQERRQQLLGRVRELLQPSGLLLLSETLLDDDRRGPLLPALLALNMLLASRGGGNFTAAEWQQTLRDGGFGEARVFRNGGRGLRDLMIARRL